MKDPLLIAILIVAGLLAVVILLEYWKMTGPTKNYPRKKK